MCAYSTIILRSDFGQYILKNNAVNIPDSDKQCRNNRTDDDADNTEHGNAAKGGK